MSIPLKYRVAYKARELLGDKACLFFSSGSDSMAMLDLLRYVGFRDLLCIFTYFLKDLEYKNQFLRLCEKTYGCRIEQIPSYNLRNAKRNSALTAKPIQTKGRKEAWKDDEAFVRAKYNVDYIFYGHRKSESLGRRGLLNNTGGIDHKARRIYPLMDWSMQDKNQYIQSRNIYLCPENRHGMRDIISFGDVDSLLWLKNNYPRDYAKALSQFPLLEAMLERDNYYGRWAIA